MMSWGKAGRGDWVTIYACLLYTSDAADERSSVDLGGRRIIKKKNREGRGGSGGIRERAQPREQRATIIR